MRLVEEQSRVSVAEVMAVAGWPAGPRVFLLDGNPVRVTRDCQGRAWFACPKCGGRCKHLYPDQFVCRICAGPLHYASEYCSMPSAHRIARMRRQAGVNPTPFAPIVRHPRGRERFHRRVRLIRLAEQMLLTQLAEFNDAAERRLARTQPAGSTASAKRKKTNL